AVARRLSLLPCARSHCDRYGGLAEGVYEDPSGLRLSHHVRRAVSARERHDQIRLSFFKHALITDGASPPPVDVPVGLKGLDVETVCEGPFACLTVGPTGATFDDDGPARTTRQLTKRATKPIGVVEVATATHQHSHGVLQ